MITGRQKIMEWFNCKPDFPYWALYYRGKTASGMPVARMRETEGIAKREGSDELEKHLNLLARGSYTLTAMPKAQIAGRGAESVDFEIIEGIGSAYDGTTPQPAVVQGFTSEDVTRAVDAAMAKYKQEVELADMKKELAELRKEKLELEKNADDPFTKIAGVLAPHLPGLLGIQTPGVAGIPIPAPAAIHHQNITPMNDSQIITDTEVQLSEADENRLSEALGVFAETDPDWLTTLERMANKLKSQPSLLNMLKSFL